MTTQDPRADARDASPPVPPRRRTAFFVVGVVVTLLTVLPYLDLSRRAHELSPAGSVYTWILPPFPEDALSYLAWAKQAEMGDLVFKVKFTSIPHEPVVVQPFFLLAGKLSAATGASLGASLQLLRLLGVVSFLLILRWFLEVLGLGERQALIAFALVGLSSGVGWLCAGSTIDSADLWLVDLNTLWSLTWNPLLAVSLCFMVGAIGLTLRGLERHEAGRLRPFLGAGAATGALTLIHPYDAIVVASVVTALLARELRWAALRPIVAYAVPFAPLGLRQLALALTDPVLAAHAGAAMRSPPLLSLGLGLGLPLGFGLGEVVAGRRSQGRTPRALGIWILVALALAYLPSWVQRKMLFGVHVPVCILGALGIDRLVGRSRGRAAAAGAFALVLATTPTHRLNWLRARADVRRDPLPYFVPPEYLEAFRFLGGNSRRDDVVLADYELSRLIPGLAGNTVVFGHWAQSVDLKKTMSWYLALGEQSPLDDGAKQRLLLASRVRFVLVDAALRRDLGGVPPWLRAVTTVVFDRDGLTILRLSPG